MNSQSNKNQSSQYQQKQQNNQGGKKNNQQKHNKGNNNKDQKYQMVSQESRDYDYRVQRELQMVDSNPAGLVFAKKEARPQKTRQFKDNVGVESNANLKQGGRRDFDDAFDRVSPHNHQNTQGNVRNAHPNSQTSQSQQQIRGRGRGHAIRDNLQHRVQYMQPYRRVYDDPNEEYGDENKRPDQSNQQDLLGLKQTQDRKPVKMMNPYKDFQKPCFYQGPKYSYNRERKPQNSKQHYYTEGNFDHIQTNQRPMDLHPTNRAMPDNYPPINSKKKYERDMHADEFDLKHERIQGNKFWKGAQGHIDHRAQEVAAKKKRQEKAGKGDRKKPSKEANNIFGDDKPSKKQKDNKNENNNNNKNSNNNKQYEKYIIDKKQIEIGLEKGNFFKGILRVNQNDRKQGFVSVDGIKVDIFLDGLNAQNCALDGDTVLLKLSDFSQWRLIQGKSMTIEKVKKPENKDQNLPAITNDTVVETRVIDEEKPATTTDDQKSQNSQEVVEDDGNSDFEDIDDDDEEVKSEDDNKWKEKQNELQSHAKDQQKQQQEFNQMDKEEKLAKINELVKELRPRGKVVSILQSPHMKKEQLVTIMAIDKELLDYKTALKLLPKQSKEADSQDEDGQPKRKQKKNNHQLLSKSIYAVNVVKKLPWMLLDNLPEEFVEDIQNNKNPQNRYYTASIKQWKQGTARPICTIKSSIGEAGNIEAESMRLLKMHDILADSYEAEGESMNSAVDESLKVFTKDIHPETGEWIIPEDEIKKRLDLRKKRIFTIDPKTAKDLDDALSVEQIEGSIYEIGVHIADVSYFVQQGTELDKQAQLRCTSTYFVHKVYPMLPRLLCERLCSLNPNVERLAYSVFFRMDMETGELVKSHQPVIIRSVINSCAKWNYELVQDILDGKITNVEQIPEQLRPVGQSFEDCQKDCFLMNKIAQKRRSKRLENGSVMLHNREFIFKLNPENKNPISFEEAKRIESKALVEEYMLLANILVAENIMKFCGGKALLRAHADVEEDKKDKLADFFTGIGLENQINLENSTTLSKSLQSLMDDGVNQDKLTVVMRKFLSNLMQAKYVCVEDLEPSAYSHYGLNFPVYTHFTSPIRRYADLLVHRLTTLSLQYKEETSKVIQQIDYTTFAAQCTEKSMNAKNASKACQRFFHCLMIKSWGEQAYECLLFDIDQQSIYIYIEEVNMHQKIRIRDDPRITNILYHQDDLKISASYKVPLKSADDQETQESIDPRMADAEAQDEEEKPLTKKQKNKLKKKQLAQPQFSEKKKIFKIFDKVKVKVETTTEFPLDIKCSLILTEDDHQDYDQIVQKQKLRQQAANQITETTQIATENDD